MKRITIIGGHYGSGKSEFSLNFAVQKKCDILLDLDIVNPYFRSRELEKTLQAHHIQVIGSSLRDALGSDLPFLAKNVYAPFLDKSKKVVVDLGGDPVGARLMRQFSEMLELDDIDFLVCVNGYREKTQTKEQVMAMIRSLEVSSGIKVTGIIHTSHLLSETTIEAILCQEEMVKEAASLLKLPICYTAMVATLQPNATKVAGELLPLQLYLRQNWL